MLNVRLYIIQFLGIFALFCGYFLSDPPDSLSVMHFNPESPSVISKKVNTEHVGCIAGCYVKQGHSSDSRSTNISSRHTPYEVMLPSINVGYSHSRIVVNYNLCLPGAYYYLYYREINPPPPKIC